MSRIILMANDKPGALIAKFLKESGDNIKLEHSSLDLWFTASRYSE